MTRYPIAAAFLLLGCTADSGAEGQGPQASEWQEVAPMSVGRSEMRAVVLDGKFYVAGGFNTDQVQLKSVEAYDPATDTWTPRAAMPVGMDHHMMAAHGGKLYVLKYADIHIYDPVGNTWSARPDSSGMTRDDGTAVTLGEHIYVLGGGPLPIQRFQPATGKWETMASLLTARGHLNAVVLDGKIWVLGGRSGNTAYRTVEIFDPVTNTVVAGPPMDSVRSGHAAEVVNGKIVVVGGEVPNPTRLARTAEIYDPGTGDWSFLSAPVLPVHGVASANWDGRIYLLGGATVPFSATNTNRAFYLEISGSTRLRDKRSGSRREDVPAQIGSWGAVFGTHTGTLPWKDGRVRLDGKTWSRLVR